MSNVESWCTVELTADQSYTRKQRKHHPEQFKSSVFQVYNTNSINRNFYYVNYHDTVICQSSCHCPVTY